MADYYIRRINTRGSYSITVVMHIPTPAGNNFVNKPYSECIKEDPEVPNTSVLSTPPLDTTVQTALDNGTLVERVVDVKMSENLSKANKQAEIESAYASQRTKVQDRIISDYDFWGGEGTVP